MRVVYHPDFPREIKSFEAQYSEIKAWDAISSGRGGCHQKDQNGTEFGGPLFEYRLSNCERGPATKFIILSVFCSVCRSRRFAGVSFHHSERFGPAHLASPLLKVIWLGKGVPTSEMNGDRQDACSTRYIHLANCPSFI
jgi:hypothetical protein